MTMTTVPTLISRNTIRSMTASEFIDTCKVVFLVVKLALLIIRATRKKLYFNPGLVRIDLYLLPHISFNALVLQRHCVDRFHTHYFVHYSTVGFHYIVLNRVLDPLVFGCSHIVILSDPRNSVIHDNRAGSRRN